MKIFTILLSFSLLTFTPIFLHAQREIQIIDSLKLKYSEAKTLVDKSKIAGEISQYSAVTNFAESERWGNLALENAESSRDRKAIIGALIANGVKFMSQGAKKENVEKAQDFFEQAREQAKANGLEKQYCESLLYLGWVYRNRDEYDKALTTSIQALSTASNLKDDSLLTVCNLAYGSSQLRKQEKLLALRSYFEASRIAEKSKNPVLLRTVNNTLINFYSQTKNYDKSLDFAFKNLHASETGTDEMDGYQSINDLNAIARLFSAQKKTDLAISFFEKAIARADSLNIAIMKSNSFSGIIDAYLTNDQPQKALAYSSSHPELQKVMQSFGLGNVIDFVSAYAYGELKKYDSADYFYKRATPFYETKVTNQIKISYFLIYGTYLRKKGAHDEAIKTFTSVYELCNSIKDIGNVAKIAAELDTAYRQKGNFKQALFFKDVNTAYKDSLDKLGKQDEILKLQIEDEEKRKEIQMQEEAAKIERRNSIQYMAIVLAIVGLFILLAVMGFYNVSARTIRALGFFSFLMLFEFAFLILKIQIHHITHGEPWKDLLALIVIAAILVPLHHWLEHKVIHYLSTNKLKQLVNKRHE